jgi:hypothetical protein
MTRGAIAPLTHMFHGIFLHLLCSAEIYIFLIIVLLPDPLHYQRVRHPTGASKHGVLFQMQFFSPHSA